MIYALTTVPIVFVGAPGALDTAFFAELTDNPGMALLAGCAAAALMSVVFRSFTPR